MSRGRTTPQVLELPKQTLRPGRGIAQLPLQRLWLAAVLLLSIALRFYRLRDRGLVYWDEGKFALEGARMSMALRDLWGASLPLSTGKAVGTAKPTHALLIGLADVVLGVHDYSALMMDAFLSVCGVAFCYFIARALFDPIVGIIAALFLAVSEYDVIYARSALSENDANAFLWLGVLVWVLGRNRQSRFVPGFAGLCMGVAFTTNYRVVVYAGALVVFDLIWTWYTEGPRQALHRLPLWIGGLAVAPVAWQIVDLVARSGGVVLFRSEITNRPAWYFSEVLYQLHEGKQSVLHFDPVRYLQWYEVRQGWLACALLFLGLIVGLVLRSFRWLALVVLVLVPYAIYTFAPFIVPRNLDPVLSFTSILAAAAVVTCARMLRSGGALVVVLIALAAGILGTAMSWRLTAERSGFASAAAYVLHHGNGRALTTNEILVFYLSRGGSHCESLKVPHTLKELSAYARAGYRFVILDRFTFRVSKFVGARMRRVRRFQTTYLRTASMGENLIYSENTYPPSAGPSISYVSVFYLNGRLLPAPGDLRAPACDLDRL